MRAYFSDRCRPSRGLTRLINIMKTFTFIITYGNPDERFALIGLARDPRNAVVNNATENLSGRFYHILVVSCLNADNINHFFSTGLAVIVKISRNKLASNCLQLNCANNFSMKRHARYFENMLNERMTLFPSKIIRFRQKTGGRGGIQIGQGCGTFILSKR